MKSNPVKAPSKLFDRALASSVTGVVFIHDTTLKSVRYGYVFSNNFALQHFYCMMNDISSLVIPIMHQAEISRRTFTMMRRVVSDALMVPVAALPRVMFVRIFDHFYSCLILICSML